MKNALFQLFTCCTLCFVASGLHAQTISAEDQKGVTECYDAFQSAFEHLDASGLGVWLTDNAEHIIPTGAIIRGRANVVASMTGYMEFLKTQPKPDSKETKLLAKQARYLAPDVVLYTYTEETTLHFGPKTQTEKMASSIVLHKNNGKWQADLIALTPVDTAPGMGK